MNQSNEKWRYDRIRRLYTEGYGLRWILANSPASSVQDINRAIQLPFGVEGPNIKLTSH
jgi:hypothetical protein